MPGDSSVRALSLRSLKESSKKWNRSSIQGWLNLMPHCPPLLEFWFSTLRTRKLHCLMQQNWPSSVIELVLHLAASHWTRVKKEQNIRLEETGNKVYIYISPQPAKVHTKMLAKPGSRRCQRTTFSGRYYRELWKQQEMKSISIQGWLNLMSHCPPPLEFRSQLSALESCIAKCNKIGQA